MTRAARAFVVALTGGIASGKSEVARRFEQRGIDVVDADLIARELVAPGQPALSEIAAAFGAELIGADGSLDRRALRLRVFDDAQARLKLEAILHPRVRDTLRARADAFASPYGLVVIPLLVESGQYSWVDRVLVVDTPRELQITRLMARDGVARELAESMLAAQTSREKRLAIADDVIENIGEPAALDASVESLHQRYLQLASQARA